MESSIIQGIQTFLIIILGIWGFFGTLTYLYDFLFNKKLIKYENKTYPLEQKEVTEKSKTIKELREICQTPKRGYGLYSKRLKIYRFFSIYITRILIETPITPNQITTFTIITGFASAVFFAFGNYLFSLIAALLLLSEEILDCLDGEIAKYKKLSSLKGIYLDGIAHVTLAPTVYAGITIGVFIATDNKLLLILGILATVFSALMPSIQGIKDSKFLYKLVAFSKGHNLIDLPPKKEIKKQEITQQSFFKILFKRSYNFLKFTFLKYIIALAIVFDLLPLFIAIFGIIYPLLWLFFFIKETRTGTDHLDNLIDPYRTK